MPLTFDEATHTYRLDGRVVPSVTQVIGSVLPGWQADEWYLQRGRALHHACALLDRGVLNWDSVAPEIIGRVRAWQRFVADSRAIIMGIETPHADSVYRFAGTIDRILFVDGVELPVICDLKSTIEPQVRVQLGGYSVLSGVGGKRPRRAVAVELHDDATYKTLWLNDHEMRRAEQTFLAALTVHNFKTMHGIRSGAA